MEGQGGASRSGVGEVVKEGEEVQEIEDVEEEALLEAFETNLLSTVVDNINIEKMLSEILS